MENKKTEDRTVALLQEIQQEIRACMGHCDNMIKTLENHKRIIQKMDESNNKK